VWCLFIYVDISMMTFFLSLILVLSMLYIRLIYWLTTSSRTIDRIYLVLLVSLSSEFVYMSEIWWKQHFQVTNVINFIYNKEIWNSEKIQLIFVDMNKDKSNETDKKKQKWSMVKKMSSLIQHENHVPDQLKFSKLNHLFVSLIIDHWLTLV